MEVSVSQALLSASEVLKYHADGLSETSGSLDSVERIDRLHQICQLKEMMKYLETQAAIYRIDYE